MAHRDKRVVITLDRDFAEYLHRRATPLIGVIYLDLPLSLRFTPEINRILYTFFTGHVESVDLERSLVILTGETVSILGNPDE